MRYSLGSHPFEFTHSIWVMSQIFSSLLFFHQYTQRLSDILYSVRPFYFVFRNTFVCLPSDFWGIFLYYYLKITTLIIIHVTSIIIINKWFNFILGSIQKIGIFLKIKNVYLQYSSWIHDIFPDVIGQISRTRTWRKFPQNKFQF